MIICKTPLRVSFFGGGTDFPEFYSRHGGAVLGTAIDKHIYHSITRFPSELFDYSIRLAYRKVECVRSLEQIEHVPFREILRHFGVAKDVEISLASDLPSFSGLGSSSSFTVGLINALSAHQGKHIGRYELAHEAIRLEREVLKEAVGCQDQIFAAHGGINLIEFSGGKDFVVHRLPLTPQRLEELNTSLLMFFTGVTRKAADIEMQKVASIPANTETLMRMLKQVEKAHAILTGNGPLSGFGELLDATWKDKRNLNAQVSSPDIDNMYRQAMGAGALGGKILGAGGGGFMLLFVPTDRQDRVRAALKGFYEVPFNINSPGSGIIHS